MKVKRYVVNAVPEALPMIRTDLGLDAVILNTKEIRVGGFLGMFGKKKMEVIAAVDTNTSKQSTPVRSKPVQSRPAAAAISPHPAARSESSAALGESESYTPPPAIAAVQRADTSSIPLEVPKLNTASVEAKAPSKDRQAKEKELLDEILEMKKWVLQISKQQHMEALPAPLQELHDRLLEQEVGEQWIERLIETIQKQLQEDEEKTIERESAWRMAKAILIEWLQDFQGEGIHPDTRVVHFVGPTGVGKTTSIAKLAAEQTLKAGRKVGFITSDTYRIAAVDQLRTYATILNVPLEVVFSPAEVSRAFKQLEDRELIFMDTAGRNFRNELYVSEVNSLLQTDSQSETYLVLSLTGKYRDMATVAEHFAKYDVGRVVFTKQDETNAYGAILNLALEQGLKPAYIAYGQTVPDDITPFRTDSYVEQLLGDWND
ncbi:Flagellar biosynthesis protein FlhF [Paenibacillus plantiphilus]|uniref:Flagellar biosynthesis protein FlhF n=1 Tax=Paenibacillus plantiphilus TaxID=2905650 RepID=A0ABM9BZA1_9BACL|nr:flagellar biosynthesis protein FlhF [Paenibacillus plantiphilus]CAH1197818.1 Flagellar biosynthesis protein FlhF [Paenibacillus plantiphilus]